MGEGCRSRDATLHGLCLNFPALRWGSSGPTALVVTPPSTFAMTTDSIPAPEPRLTPVSGKHRFQHQPPGLITFFSPTCSILLLELTMNVILNLRNGEDLCSPLHPLTPNSDLPPPGLFSPEAH